MRNQKVALKLATQRQAKLERKDRPGFDRTFHHIQLPERPVKHQTRGRVGPSDLIVFAPKDL